VLHSDANLSQRLVGFRILALIPLLYFIGRSFGAEDDYERLTVVWLALGAAAVVTLFGILELFFIPTRVWLDWGVNLYSSFLGFKYGGPAGLPENFFLTLSDGTLVRRMVSTYVSPLGIAYTALVLFPMAVAVMDRRVPQRTARWMAILTVLLVLGVTLSITRLALLCLIAEAGLMFLLLRRAWIAGLVPVLVVATIVALYPYTSIAQAVDRNLQAVHRGGLAWAISGHDPSAREHSDYLLADLKFDLQHPLGLGTGASTIRYGKLIGTGESAVLGMFGDMGIIGGLLYIALYGLAIWNGWRALRMTRRNSLEELIPLIALVGGLGLIPITMTSDMWGDLSVTFLFWWAAGASATLSKRAAREEARAVWRTRPATSVS
jgi:O-antigen ligase